MLYVIYITSLPSCLYFLLSDLWALGVIAYQMYAGVTAFQAPTPFLTFLRVKRAKLMFPSTSIIPQVLQDFITLLLVKDKKIRFENALGKSDKQPVNVNSDIVMDIGDATITVPTAVPVPTSVPITAPLTLPVQEQTENQKKVHASLRGLYAITDYDSINYNTLRTHPYFSSSISSSSATVTDSVSISNSSEGNYSLVKFQELHNYPAVRIPTLKELCYTEVGQAALIVAEKIAYNGGVRPSTPWIQVLLFNCLH